MPVSEDLRQLETDSLKERKAALEKHQRFAAGDLGNVRKARKRRELEREAAEMGPFTPEKQSELLLAKKILDVREEAKHLLTDASIPAVREEFVPAQPTRAPGEWGSEAEYTLESPSVVRELWERGFAQVQEKEKEGVYGPCSRAIWEGLKAMYAEKHWHEWPVHTMPQDHTSKPIIFNIAPTDPDMGGEKWMVSTRMLMPGINAHAAQQFDVTPTWAGIGMVKALAHHFATNHRLSETRQFATAEGITSPAYNELKNIIGNDATAIYMYGLDHASGGKFFAEVQKILAEKGLTHTDQLRNQLDMQSFLTGARRLDKLFTDEPPRSPAEVRERLNAYSDALVFVLKSTMLGPGEHFAKPGLYNSDVRRKSVPQTLAAYLTLFSPPVTAVEAVHESIEKPLGEKTLEWWAKARDTLARIRGEQRAGVTQIVEELRQSLPRADKVAMRVFEAVTAIDRWWKEHGSPELGKQFIAICEPNAPDADVFAVRQAIKKATEALRFQAFLGPRVDQLSVQEIQELLLVTFQALRQTVKQGLPKEGAEKVQDFITASNMSEKIGYTLLRENTSQKVRTAAKGIYDLTRTRGSPTMHLDDRDVVSNLLSAHSGCEELPELEYVARELSRDAPNLPAEIANATRAYDRASLPFAYIEECGAEPGGPKLAIAHDPEENRTRGLISLLGATLPDGYARQSILPNHCGMPDTGLTAICDETKAVYGFTVVGGSLQRFMKNPVPETWSPGFDEHRATVRHALPLLLQRRRREVGVICSHVPEEVRAKTVFVEHSGDLYARCPDDETAAHYGEQIILMLPPSLNTWKTVKLKTIKQLEAELLTGARVEGKFFPGKEPAEGIPVSGETGGQTLKADEEGEKPAPVPQARLRSVRDVLLKNRIAATVSFDSAGAQVPQPESSAPAVYDYESAPSGRWVVIDVPAHNKQIFVSDDPERTYVYPGIQPLQEYLRSDSLTPRQLQARGAKQIFWNTEEQFSASLTQAITAETWTNIDEASVDALIARHGDLVRQRLESLISHVNSQPVRTEQISLETLKFGALREGVKSGRAAREPHCGHTIVKDLARMAGLEDPLSYRALKDFFDRLMEAIVEKDTTEQAH